MGESSSEQQGSGMIPGLGTTHQIDDLSSCDRRMPNLSTSTVGDALERGSRTLVRV